MLVPSRHGSAESYRYGFQGQEKDDELKGDGNSLNYTYRMHDPRIGRFFAIDPLTKKYPYYTPYSFSGNKVINSRELEGLEEYESYNTYAADKGKNALKKMDGSDGAWTTNDREKRNSVWSNAMEFVTKNMLKANDYFKHSDINKLGDVYSFEIVRDYYNWIIHNMDNKGYSSRWAIGASYLCDELADTFQEKITSGNMAPMPIGDLLKDLNLGIANYAIGKFNKVLYKNEKVTNWYDWDSNFIVEEQVTKVAPRVYKNWAGTASLWALNKLSRNEGFAYFVSNKHTFPDFSVFGVDITDAKTDFGASGRYHIPMLMLYTSHHANNNFSGASYYNNSAQKQQIDKAHKEIMQYYYDSMKY